MTLKGVGLKLYYVYTYMYVVKQKTGIL